MWTFVVDHRLYFSHGICFLFWFIYALSIRVTNVAHHLPFWEQDPSKSFLYTSSQVPSWLLYVLSVLIPLFAIILDHFIHYSPHRKMITGWQVYGLVQCIAIATAVYNTVKVCVGGLRPNFFYICNYAGFQEAVDTGNFTSYFDQTSSTAVGTLSRCMASHSEIQDAQKSFFSGHAVISFVGLLYTTFLLRRVLLVPAGVWTSAESLLCTAPLFLASWISLTRIQDGEHHPVDVVAGTLVGILIASLVWTTVQNIVKAELKKVSSTPIQSSGNLG